MSPYNQNISDYVALLGSIPPASQAVGTVSTPAIATTNARRLLFAVHAGALGGTVDFKIQACATSGGSYADVPGLAITQITTGAENIAFLGVSAEYLKSLGVGPYVKGVLTIGTGASLVSVACYGAALRFEPASDYNSTKVTQISNFNG